MGAQIGGNLECDNATFHNPPQKDVTGSGTALNTDSAVVKGNVFLRNGFSAEGEVNLLSAQIGSGLDCTRGKFDGKLTAQRATISSNLFWRDIADAQRAKLDLTNVSAGALEDDVESWPTQRNLRLDGFAYKRISGGPRDAKRRLAWLSRQDSFSTQPYRQLAKVMREEGDDVGARRVLFTMEHRRRKQPDRTWLRWPRRIWGWMLLLTVGYGYYPALALLWLLLLTGSGLKLYWTGYDARSVVPTDKEAYACFKKSDELPSHYERFHASAYSLENVFPLVKLGQSDRWQPDPNPPPFVPPGAKWIARVSRFFFSAPFLRWFRWAQICLGWFFATMGVAGVTGIVRKE